MNPIVVKILASAVTNFVIPKVAEGIKKRRDRKQTPTWQEAKKEAVKKEVKKRRDKKRGKVLGRS